MSTGSSEAKPPPRTPITEQDDQGASRPLIEKLGWFAGLWFAGLALTAALAYGLKALLR
jgi:hypothetical protein